ncbi:hypothetical protein ACIRJO_13505 [Streptomyces sp. NPDC102394]|uniref:hypothetical protein n=1 Tax=Streptomyces sp. NPDC102394 TaxID=3366167 RepID=UPI0038256990
MRQRDVHDELRARLHEAAEAHEPDRARMLARIERGMGSEADRAGHRATRPQVWSWVRVVGATTAVAGMLAVGGYAVASAVKDDAPPQQTVAVSPTPRPSPDATSRAPVPPVEPAPSRTPGTHRPSGIPSPTKPSASVTVLPSAGGESDGPLWADGAVDPHSNDFWAQSDITLRTSAHLTSLVVQLKVAQTGGVSNTGAWRSLPEQDFDLTVGERDGFLVYTWTLKAGRTVPTGEWVFAGQYNHQRGGRDAKDDGYTVRATAEGRQRAVGGGFAAHTSGADGS